MDRDYAGCQGKPIGRERRAYAAAHGRLCSDSSSQPQKGFGEGEVELQCIEYHSTTGKLFPLLVSYSTATVWHTITGATKLLLVHLAHFLPF